MIKRHGIERLEPTAYDKYSEEEEDDVEQDTEEAEYPPPQSAKCNIREANTTLTPSADTAMSGIPRVNCHICKKEVCNKYFLKQHVQHRHKITFGDYLNKYGLQFSNSTTPNQHNKLKKYFFSM